MDDVSPCKTCAPWVKSEQGIAKLATNALFLPLEYQLTARIVGNALFDLTTSLAETPPGMYYLSLIGSFFFRENWTVPSKACDLTRNAKRLLVKWGWVKTLVPSEPQNSW